MDRILFERSKLCQLSAVLLLLLVNRLPLRAESGGAASARRPEQRGTESEETVPDDDALEAAGAVVGKIRIRVHNIFDLDQPDEDRRAFRVVDRLHRKTRDTVVLHQLLFKSGDPYSRRVLDESERALRADRYLREAEIRAVHYDGHTVDIQVDTQDTWTTRAGFGVGRSGGTNTVHFQLEDLNLLGSGRTVALQHESNVDRTSALIRFQDNHLAGSHARLGLWYSNNSDGSFRQVDLGKPFYSLDTRRAAGLLASDDDRVDSLYTLGHIRDRFAHRETRLELRGGRSRGLVDGRARRWSLGYTFERDEFAPAPGQPSPVVLPGDRTLSYPWIAYDVVEDAYVEAHDQDQMKRTEDLHLGHQLHLQLGWSTPFLGADRNAAVFEGRAGWGFQPAEGQTVLLAAGGAGRWGSGGGQNLTLGGSARYFRRDLGRHLLYATLELDAARNLDPETQLLLGGDSGLRGYPLRYQEGDGRLLLTVEQRFFTDLQLLHVVNVGAAVFFDAGRTWAGASKSPNLGWLKDVGAGLRVGSNRSGLGSVVHFDVAFPLDGDPSIKKVQWLVTSKTSF
jgi:hypothetical protein